MAYNLELIDSIDRESISALAGEDVITTSDLLARCRSVATRRQLAHAIGVDEARLRKWVALADLSRIVGLPLEMTKLLYAAGIDSTRRLGVREPDSLVASLAWANEYLELRLVPPDSGTAAAWISHARQLAEVGAPERLAIGTKPTLGVPGWRERLLDVAPVGSLAAAEDTAPSQDAGSDDSAVDEWDDLSTTKGR